MTADIEIQTDTLPGRHHLVGLYDAVGWTAYTNEPQALLKAIIASDFLVTAWRERTLVGLARCLSDDAAVCYIQDILVHPEHQRTGLGRRLVEACLERYAHVRMTVLLTDDRPEQHAFYAALGFANTRDLEKTKLNAFVKARDGGLS